MPLFESSRLDEKYLTCEIYPTNKSRKWDESPKILYNMHMYTNTEIEIQMYIIQPIEWLAQQQQQKNVSNIMLLST